MARVIAIRDAGLGGSSRQSVPTSSFRCGCIPGEATKISRGAGGSMIAAEIYSAGNGIGAAPLIPWAADDLSSENPMKRS